MGNVILIIDKEKGNDFYNKILAWFKKEKKKILLLGIAANENEEKEVWHYLFSLCEKFEEEKIPFSLGMEKGSLFNLFNLIRNLEIEMIFLPKSKFLNLGEEYEDFLKELPIPILLY